METSRPRIATAEPINVANETKPGDEPIGAVKVLALVPYDRYARRRRGERDDGCDRGGDRKIGSAESRGLDALTATT